MTSLRSEPAWAGVALVVLLIAARVAASRVRATWDLSRMARKPMPGKDQLADLGHALSGPEYMRFRGIAARLSRPGLITRVLQGLIAACQPDNDDYEPQQEWLP